MIKCIELVSFLAKTTIKTLRYYESEKLLIPSFVDEETGYRFYETKQLLDVSKIVALRQIGMSIDDIKKILSGQDLNDLLLKRKEELESEMNIYEDQLSRINYLLEGKNMKYEVIKKTLPDYTVYYKEGVVENFSNVIEFILESGEECRKLNPNIKCIEPDYCFVSYLDGEYKESNMKIRYSQAVDKVGIGNENIKFEILKPVEAVCVYHKGSYNTLTDSYSFLIKWIEENNYEITEPIRERYIDGMWNKETEEEWLTEIQIPIRKK